MVNFSFFFFFFGWCRSIPCSIAHGVYISQLTRFARVFNHITDFNAFNKILQLNFSNRAINIINFGKLFKTVTDDTVNWLLDTSSD